MQMFQPSIAAVVEVGNNGMLFVNPAASYSKVERNTRRVLSQCVLQIRFSVDGEILLEIGFIEEMRTTWVNKETPQPFFQNPSCSRK